MKTLKLLIGDPAKSGDAFGVVGLEGTYPEKKIYTRHAKQFWKQPYRTVARYFFHLNRVVHFDMMLIEKNFDYDKVRKAFESINITYVTTSANLSENTRTDGWSVDKPYMINWMVAQHRDHFDQYPAILSGDMKELVNQQNEMVGITAPSGHVSYKRTRNRHDDLFMAKLIGCNAIRIWWDMQQ